MAMQIIDQDCHTPRLKALCIAFYPSFGSLLLADLFLVAVLGRDELRLQADHMLLLWRTHDRHHHQVRVVCLFIPD